MVLILFLMLLTGALPLPFIQSHHLSLFWQLSSIYIIVFLVSTCAQFFNPSTYTLLGDIVPEADLTRAFGLNQIVQSIATIIGPAVAGFLVFGIGIQWILFLNALSFAISFLSIQAIHVSRTSVRTEPEQHKPFFHEFLEGVRFLLGSVVLRTMSISTVMNMVAYGTLGALDIFFVTENLHVSAHIYGFLGASAGVGSIVGALLAGHLVKRFGQIKTSWMAMVAMGILILIFACQTSFLPSLGLFALFGGANAISIVAMEPLTLQATPRMLLGRVSSVTVTSWTLALIIATALAGYLDSTIFNHLHHVILGITFNSVDTLFTGAGVLLIISGIYFGRTLRGVTLTKEGEFSGGATQGLEIENEK